MLTMGILMTVRSTSGVGMLQLTSMYSIPAPIATKTNIVKRFFGVVHRSMRRLCGFAVMLPSP